MPVVVVEMWQGRTEEQKAKLIKGISRAFERSAFQLIIYTS